MSRPQRPQRGPADRSRRPKVAGRMTPRDSAISGDSATSGDSAVSGESTVSGAATGAESAANSSQKGDTVDNPPTGRGVKTETGGAPKSIVLAAGGIGLVAIIAAGVLVGVHGTGALIGKASNDNIAFIDSAGTSEVQDRAEAALAGIFSYSYQTLDEDFDTARSFLTESMREDYESTIETTRQAAEQREASVQMAVRRSGVVSLTRNTAEVLALAVVSTETGGIPDQQFSGPILVDLALVDGEWLVDSIRER